VSALGGMRAVAFRFFRDDIISTHRQKTPERRYTSFFVMILYINPTSNSIHFHSSFVFIKYEEASLFFFFTETPAVHPAAAVCILLFQFRVKRKTATGSEL